MLTLAEAVLAGPDLGLKLTLLGDDGRRAADLSKVLALPKPAPNRASLVDFATKINAAAAEDPSLGGALRAMKKWKALGLLLF